MNTYTLRRAGSGDNPDSPQYRVSYGRPDRLDLNVPAGRALREALFGQAWLHLEVDSTLLALAEPEREPCVLDLRRALQERSIDIRLTSTPLPPRGGIFGKLRQQTGEQVRLGTVLSPGQWRELDDRALLPRAGLRLSKLPAGHRGETLLDDIQNGRLVRRELAELFELVAFDVVAFGQMGISSRVLDRAALARLLPGAAD